MIGDVLADLSYGVRTLRRSPGFTVLMVLSLAVGIGANAAIFSVVNFVFLRPLPVRDPEGLVLFSDGFSAGTSNGRLASPGPLRLYSCPLFEPLRADHHSFTGLAGQQSGFTTAVVRWGDDSADLAEGRAV